jgi:hypothetical protein
MKAHFSATADIALNEFVAANRTPANSHFRPKVETQTEHSDRLLLWLHRTLKIL